MTEVRNEAAPPAPQPGPVLVAEKSVTVRLALFDNGAAKVSFDEFPDIVLEHKDPIVALRDVGNIIAAKLAQPQS
jgi:hypothetical protein